jgi:hypothetical protein
VAGDDTLGKPRRRSPWAGVRPPHIGDVYEDMRPRSVKNGQKRYVTVIAIELDVFYDCAVIHDNRSPSRRYFPRVDWFYGRGASRSRGFRYVGRELPQDAEGAAAGAHTYRRAPSI